MEFLVQCDIALPPDMEQEAQAVLLAREATRARALMAEGALVRIWRVPGRYANIGIWSAPDATVLHDAVSSLPLFPYMDVEVTALAAHYLEAEAAPGA